MNRQELLDKLTQDVLGYVMHGHLSDDVLVESLKPEGLADRFDDYQTLIDLHFVLRDDVVAFVRELPQRLRQLETSTESRTRTSRGTVRGRVNWSQTARVRSTQSPGDRSLFVCDTRTETYDTDENIVLKRLLATVYQAVENAQEYLNSEYEWVNEAWRGEEGLLLELQRIMERNVHVRRIREPEQYEPTDRMLVSSENSRQPVYREAAGLVREYRAIHQGESTAVRNLLEQTAITPDDEETLLELYVLFRFIATIEDLHGGEFTVSTIESGRQEIARLSGPKEIVLYHDTSGGDRGLSFRSVPEEKSDGELSRTEAVQRAAQRVARDYFGQQFQNHTGRPDVIVLEVIDENAGSYEYLITEVKNSTRVDTIRGGIKETLEYLAFLRQDGEYVNGSKSGGAFFGDGSNGLLVVQDMPERETQPFSEQEGIGILQVGKLDEQLESVLADIV